MPVVKASTYSERTKRIMAIGPIRAGKTLGFCTIPGKKFAWCFEPNALDTLRQYGPEIDVMACLPDNLNINAVSLTKGRADNSVSQREPIAYREFAEEFDRFWGDPNYPYYIDNYDAVLFDSLTAFQGIVMDRQLWLNGRSGKWPEQSDWTGAMNTMTSVMRTLTAANTIIYATAHTDLKETKLLGIIQQLRLIGDLRNTLPGLFTDLWYFTAGLDASNQPIFSVQTRSDDEKRMLGTSMNVLEVHEDVTVDFSLPIEGQGVASLLKKAGLTFS